MNLCECLGKINSIFRVSDIMTHQSHLICGHDENHAFALSQQYPEFDVIPLRIGKDIREYFNTRTRERSSISVLDIIADTAGIFDAVTNLSIHPFCFVGDGRHVTGFLHFSDLNHPVVKIPFFVIFAELETLLHEKMSSLIQNDVLKTKLDHDRYCHILRRIERVKKDRADYSLMSMMYLSEKLFFATQVFQILPWKQRECDTILQFRNRICHAGDALVQKHEDVMGLHNAKALIMNVLNCE